MLLTRFTRPVSPHLTHTPGSGTFFSSYSPLCYPFPAFSGRFPHACTFSSASSSSYSSSLPRFLSVILGHQSSSLLFRGKSRVNSSMPLRRQSACSMGKSALMLNACFSSITSASTWLPHRTLLHSKRSRILMNLASRDNTFVASYSYLICHNNVHVAMNSSYGGKEKENKTICEMLFKTRCIKKSFSVFSVILLPSR
ncbi:hypothetical protein L210DRAFT_264693, partial [Boletus edulis BED1]